MRYGTICSGIDGVSLAWEPLGFEAKFFSEIEPFPKAVLAHHWPTVPDLGDFTQIVGSEWKDKIDILWGSCPCQAFSLAGRREGSRDPRGALTMSFCDLADDIDPSFVCFENVKGILSDGKNAFGCLLAALAGEDEPFIPPGKKWTHAGYVLGPRRRIAWRLLNAQHSGVAQRRERVFVVACPIDGVDPRDILFETNTGSQAPERRSRRELVSALKGSSPERAFSVAFRGRKNGEQCEVGDQVANCLLASTGGSDKAFALVDDGVHPIIRQLSPIECERLMGMPDDFTLVPFGKKFASDSVRYKAIGNSLVIPEVRWLGERIKQTSKRLI